MCKCVDVNRCVFYMHPVVVVRHCENAFVKLLWQPEQVYTIITIRLILYTVNDLAVGKMIRNTLTT